MNCQNEILKISDGISQPKEVPFFGIDLPSLTRANTGKRATYGSYFVRDGDRKTNPASVGIKTPIFTSSAEYAKYLEQRDEIFKDIYSARYLILGNRALELDGITNSKQTTTNNYNHTDSQNSFTFALANPYWQDVDFNVISGALAAGTNNIIIETLGDAETPFQIDLSGVNLQILSLQIDSRKLSYDNETPFIVGDVLEIDTENGDTKIAGIGVENNILNGSQFPRLQPSASNILIIEVDAVANYEIRYKNNWRL